MAMNNFDDNIIQNILSRLSLKHANQLKLVCTRWNDLISDRFFKKTHAVQSINNLLGIITVTTKSALYIPIERCKGNNQKLPDIPDPSKACIKAVCNGLIFYEPTSQSNNDCYLLSNMTTKSSTSIPKEHLLTVTGTVKAVFGLAFHPSSQTTPVVVACIHSHKKIYFCKYSHPPREKGHNWRIMEEPFRTEFELAKTASSVFVNGALHWLSESGDKAVAFNVENDTAYTVELPVKYRVQTGYCYDVWFGVANEKLCILKLDCEVIYIWEMRDYCTKGTTWVCTKINMPKGPNKCYSYNMPVLYDGKKVVVFTWTTKSRGVAVYRIQEKKWDKILSFRDWACSDRLFFPYVGHAYSLD